MSSSIYGTNFLVDLADRLEDDQREHEDKKFEFLRSVHFGLLFF